MQDADDQLREYPADEPWRTPLDDLERTLYEVVHALSSLRVALEAGRVRPRALPQEPPRRLGPREANLGNGHSASFQQAWERVSGAAGHETPEDAGTDLEAASPVGEAAGPETPEPDTAAIESEAEQPEIAESEVGLESAEETPEDEDFNRVWNRLQRERGVDVPDETEGSMPTNLKDIWDKLHKDREQRGEDLGLDAALMPSEYRMTIEDRDGTPIDPVPIHRALLKFANPGDIELLTYANGVPVVSFRTEQDVNLDELAETVGAVTDRQCEVIPQDQGKLFLRLSSGEDEA